MSSNWLAPEVFSTACGALPLVSLDLCLTRPGPAGPELLLGFRTNRPAQGFWFTPGGRVRKNEPMGQALARLALDEIGLPEHLLQRAVLMGAWDHFYPDSAFDTSVSTHYVNLPHWLELSEAEAATLQLPGHAADQDRYAGQHAHWRWQPVDQAATDPTVHPYAQAYATWMSLNMKTKVKPMPTPIRKAVFPIAGLGTCFLPATKASAKEMLPVIDKPLIQNGQTTDVKEKFVNWLDEGAVAN